MKLDELHNVLEKENVHKGEYSLSESEPVLCETALCIRRINSGWEYYTMDRNDKLAVRRFKNEDDAVNAFLEEMADSYPGLKKYIA